MHNDTIFLGFFANTSAPPTIYGLDKDGMTEQSYAVFQFLSTIPQTFDEEYYFLESGLTNYSMITSYVVTKYATTGPVTYSNATFSSIVSAPFTKAFPSYIPLAVRF